MLSLSLFSTPFAELYLSLPLTHQISAMPTFIAVSGSVADFKCTEADSMR